MVRAMSWFAITPRVDRDDLVADGLAFAGVPDSQTEREFYQRIAKQLLTADHGLILRNALQRAQSPDYAPTILLVLGEQFTLKQARQLYAILWRQPVATIDNSNFRKTHVHLFTEVGTARPGSSGRSR